LSCSCLALMYSASLTMCGRQVPLATSAGDGLNDHTAVLPASHAAWQRAIIRLTRSWGGRAFASNSRVTCSSGNRDAVRARVVGVLPW
jgi:hypothetical protein